MMDVGTASQDGSYLHSLPSEVLCQVLAAVDSPKDLLHFIQVSPHIHAVFEGARNTVLGSMLRSAFGAHFPEAVAACRARRVLEEDLGIWSREWVGDVEGRAWGKRLTNLAKSFLEEHFANRGISDRLLQADAELIPSLCQLWHLVNFYISNLADIALRELRLCMEKSVGSTRLQKLRTACAKPVSVTEYSRLQRGLVHFELYRRVFASAYKNRVSVPPERQAELYMRYFADWEKHEMQSVYRLLAAHTRLIYDSAEDEFVSLIQRSSFEDLIEGSRNGGFHIGDLSFFDADGDMDDSRLYVFSKEYRKRRSEADFWRFPLLGLCSLKKLHCATLSSRILFGRIFGSSPRYTAPAATWFDEVLSLSSRLIEPMETRPEHLRYQREVIPVPTAWKWKVSIDESDTRNAPSSADEMTDRRQDALLGCGYVFWDDRRWEEAGVGEDDFLPLKDHEQRLRQSTLSAQERIGRAIVPKERLNKEFDELFKVWAATSVFWEPDFTRRSWKANEY